jgi:hypothetical protein
MRCLLLTIVAVFIASIGTASAECPVIGHSIAGESFEATANELAAVPAHRGEFETSNTFQERVEFSLRGIETRRFLELPINRQSVARYNADGGFYHFDRDTAFSAFGTERWNRILEMGGPSLAIRPFEDGYHVGLGVAYRSESLGRRTWGGSNGFRVEVSSVSIDAVFDNINSERQLYDLLSPRLFFTPSADPIRFAVQSETWHIPVDADYASAFRDGMRVFVKIQLEPPYYFTISNDYWVVPTFSNRHQMQLRGRIIVADLLCAVVTDRAGVVAFSEVM